MEDLALHQSFMQRALELAELGKGKVAPNPLVGCVIVHQNKIIGEGYHRKYGEAHAEVNAVQSVVNKDLLREATVYVTLEPCSHFGKTPPCADLLVQHQVKKVVIANVDSNPLVGGKGIEKLKANGIEVITGILEKEARELNKRFFTFIEQKRPYLILKWAETADGFIAKPNFDSKWISNIYARQWVHQWRTEEAGIMVGRQTAFYDNPQLNARLWKGKNPTRIVIDRFLKLPPHLHLFDQSQATICYNTLKSEENGLVTFVKIEEEQFLTQIIEDLYQRKIQSVIIEGGSTLLQRFINAGLWDEARIFKAPTLFHQGIPAPTLSQAQFISQNHLMDNSLWVYERRRY